MATLAAQGPAAVAKAVVCPLTFLSEFLLETEATRIKKWLPALCEEETWARKGASAIEATAPPRPLQELCL